MTKILKEEITLEKKECSIVEEGCKIHLDKHYVFELSDEEVKKFYGELKGVVEKCEEELIKHDTAHLNAAIELVKEKAKKELEYKEAAIKNYRSHQTKTIREFKARANEELKQLRNFCNPEVFEKYLVLLENGTKAEFDKNKDMYDTQIKEHRPLLKVYEEYVNGN